MAAAPGNQYAAKGKAVTNALNRALAANDWKRLHAGAEKIANAFAKAEPWAVHFVADRLEGKPMMSIPDTGDRAFSITWSFGPQAIDIAGDSAEQQQIGQQSEPGEQP